MSTDSYKALSTFHISETFANNRSKKRSRCVIFGNFGAMNQGDEAILSGQLSELGKYPGITITVVGRFPQAIEKIHKVHALSFYALGKVIKEVRRADFVIIGGGGIICKIERGIIGFLYQLYMLFVFFALPLFYRKKLYALGIGVYGNTNPLILWLSCLLLKSATIVTVRDQHSRALLVKKGVKAELYKDTSFLMGLVGTKDVLVDPYFKRLYNRRKKHIGISLVRPPKKSEEKRIIAELVKFVAKTHNTADFWFYAADYHPGYFNDENFGHALHIALKKKVSRDVHFYFIPTSWDPKRFFSSLSLMDFCITMRLHAAIFAYRLQVPFFAISYDEKCSSFLHSIGKEAPRIAETHSKTILEHFQKAIQS